MMRIEKVLKHLEDLYAKETDPVNRVHLEKEMRFTKHVINHSPWASMRRYE